MQDLPEGTVVLSEVESADLMDRMFQLRCACEDLATAIAETSITIDGVRVVVGGDPERKRSWDKAVSDGWVPGETLLPWEEAVERGTIVQYLVSDAAQMLLWPSIVPCLKEGDALFFSHGFGLVYNDQTGIVPPDYVDVIMVAPRMIGVGVRERFVAGSGAPAYVAVEQDATGAAWSTALAIAKGIGATRVGALGITFAQETEMDLFMEQGVWPVITRVLILAYELLIERGFPPEAVVLEMYGSGEAAEIFQEMANVGLFKQMSFHSQTSQYGTLSRGPRMLPDAFLDQMKQALAEIQDGRFAEEWEAEQAAGYPRFTQLKTYAAAHPMNAVEEQVRKIVKGE